MRTASNDHLKETFVVSGLASLLLLILSWPAFRYFFFAEAFWHLRIYNLHDRHLLQAAFSRIDGMFFAPGAFLSQIWWDFVLPADPMVYHIRNFIICAVSLLLLYRVLLKFVRSRPARIMALGMFAVSKIHLTIIGYIIVGGSILPMTILLAVLFWFRYIETRRTADYFLTLIFGAFSVYSSDSGFAVIVILAAMIPALAVKPGELKSEILYWSVRLAPFVITSASFLILRYILTGPMNPNNPVYSPQLSIPVAAWQMKAFLATVGNFSLTNPGFMGERGLSGVLAGNSEAVEFALCGGLWLLIIYTLWRGRDAWRLSIVPVVWIGLYLFPYFLIRNHQVYYHQESLIGVVLLVGICLDRAGRPLLVTWSIAVALVAINGFISNQRSYYYWQGTADRAEIVKPIVASQKSNPPKLIVFVTSPELRDFWTFAIGGPMVPHLLGSPDTLVDVVDSSGQISPEAQVYRLPEHF